MKFSFVLSWGNTLIYTLRANRVECVITKKATMTTNINVLFPVENLFLILPLLLGPSKGLRSLFISDIVLGSCILVAITVILVLMLLSFEGILHLMIWVSFLSLSLDWYLVLFSSTSFLICLPSSVFYWLKWGILKLIISFRQGTCTLDATPNHSKWKYTFLWP